MTVRTNGMILGARIADALAMPVHWYYDREALLRDYGRLTDYKAPLRHHPDSILWRSSYVATNERGDILREQAAFWGVHGVHYHQFLQAGENTLNFQLLAALDESLRITGGYDLDDYLKRYVDFMLTPGRHRDTYVEEYHRHFFNGYSKGWKPQRCGGRDVHIGGLVAVPLLVARLGQDREMALSAVKAHVGFSHGDPDVVLAANALARMLLDVGDGLPVRDAILHHGNHWISQSKIDRWSADGDLTVIGRHLSPACYIRDAFTASLYLAWKYHDDFEQAVSANAHCGGDNCHRGAVVGSLVGGAVGSDLIPQHLVNGLVSQC